MVCRHRGAVNGLHVGHMSVTFLTDHEQVIDARNHTVHCIVARERHTQKEGPIQPCQIRTGFRVSLCIRHAPTCLFLFFFSPLPYSCKDSSSSDFVPLMPQLQQHSPMHRTHSNATISTESGRSLQITHAVYPLTHDAAAV